MNNVHATKDLHMFDTESLPSKRRVSVLKIEGCRLRSVDPVDVLEAN